MLCSNPRARNSHLGGGAVRAGRAGGVETPSPLHVVVKVASPTLITVSLRLIYYSFQLSGCTGEEGALQYSSVLTALCLRALELYCIFSVNCPGAPPQVNACVQLWYLFSPQALSFACFVVPSPYTFTFTAGQLKPSP
ncbi:unnamed protein product [Discosporangium mesarthrocarpum]